MLGVLLGRSPVEERAQDDLQEDTALGARPANIPWIKGMALFSFLKIFSSYVIK